MYLRGGETLAAARDLQTKVNVRLATEDIRRTVHVESIVSTPFYANISLTEECPLRHD